MTVKKTDAEKAATKTKKAAVKKAPVVSARKPRVVKMAGIRPERKYKVPAKR
jgi:hypothetical protein